MIFCGFQKTMWCIFFAADIKGKGISALENLGALLMLEVETLRAFDFSLAAKKRQRDWWHKQARFCPLFTSCHHQNVCTAWFFIGDLEISMPCWSRRQPSKLVISDPTRKEVEKGEKRLRAQVNRVACMPCLPSRPHLMPSSGQFAGRGSLYSWRWCNNSNMGVQHSWGPLLNLSWA